MYVVVLSLRPGVARALTHGVSSAIPGNPRFLLAAFSIASGPLRPAIRPVSSLPSERGGGILAPKRSGLAILVKQRPKRHSCVTFQFRFHQPRHYLPSFPRL